MLNPKLNIEQLTTQYSSHRRIQIFDVLASEAAEQLYTCLAHEVPWGLAFTDGTKPQLLHADEIAAFDQSAWLDVINKAQGRSIGAHQFRFAYNSYMMVEAYQGQRDPGLLLHKVLEFLNSGEFIGFMHRITTCTDVRSVMAQATRYMPGHFLTRHNDLVGAEYRRVAYVLNMTKSWRADWGGLLEFEDEQGNATETFMPTFNSLTLFQVPMWHHVSYVAPFAAAGRYAITGWGLARPTETVSTR